jgi:hypothetical protein
MNFASLRISLIAGFALPLGLAGASFAQDASPPPPGAADASPHHHRDPAEMRASMAEHLRSVLQLQPGQTAALDAYLDALKPPGGTGGHHERDRGEAQHLTTPERLDRMAARMDERRARMLSTIAATRQFYAQLSPGQQKAFDDLGPMMMGHMGHDGHGMGPGGRGPDHDHDEMGSGGPPRG